jgi:hypothetical protein
MGTITCEGVLVDLSAEVETYRVTAPSEGARYALDEIRRHLSTLGISWPRAETLARAVEDLATCIDR